jgi:D-alanyl-D-alanine carboxypeptidase
MQQNRPVPVPAPTGAPAARFTVFTLAAAFVVSGAAAPALTQEAAPAAPSPAVAEATALFDLWAGEQLDYHGVPGVVVGVVSDGRLAWAKGYGTSDLSGGVPLTPSTPFRIGSVSKVFTATAILQLRDAGKLRLDDPVVKHLPWFRVPSPFPTAPPITVEHLLTHTSGLSREGPFDAWTTHEFPTRDELKAAMPRVTVISPPGKTYRYSNLGMALLGEVVSAASGRSWADYVRDAIAGPLGMTSTTGAPTAAQVAALPRQHRRKQPDGSRGSLEYYETGAIAPAAAIVSTLEDLARFAALHLTADPAGPPAGGGQVVSASTLAEMHRPRFVYPSWSGGRGLGFGVSRRDGRTYVSHGGWIGGHRADFILDPERGLAAVALTNADDASPGLFARQALAVVGDAVVASRPAPAPPAPILFSRRRLGALPRHLHRPVGLGDPRHDPRRRARPLRVELPARRRPEGGGHPPRPDRRAHVPPPGRRDPEVRARRGREGDEDVPEGGLVRAEGGRQGVAPACASGTVAQARTLSSR